MAKGRLHQTSICTRAGLSVHLQLANTIASKVGVAHEANVVVADVVVLPDRGFLILRLT